MIIVDANDDDYDGDDDGGDHDHDYNDYANISVIHTCTSLFTFTCVYSGYKASRIIEYLNITLNL